MHLSMYPSTYVCVYVCVCVCVCVCTCGARAATSSAASLTSCPEWTAFSKVSATVQVLCRMTARSTFQKLCLHLQLCGPRVLLPMRVHP